MIWSVIGGTQMASLDCPERPQNAPYQ